MTEEAKAKRDPEENADKAAGGNARVAREGGDSRPPIKRGNEKRETPRAVPQETVEDAPKRQAKPKSAPHVIGAGERDDVHLRALVFENKFARKSLSVHHLQRRLIELGYGEAGADKDGYYSTATKAAVARFQAEEGLAVPQGQEGLMTADTLRSIFENDDNVHLVLR